MPVMDDTMSINHDPISMIMMDVVRRSSGEALNTSRRVCLTCVRRTSRQHASCAAYPRRVREQALAHPPTSRINACVNLPPLVDPDRHEGSRHDHNRASIVWVDADVHIVPLRDSYSPEHLRRDGDLTGALVDRVRMPGIHPLILIDLIVWRLGP